MATPNVSIATPPTTCSDQSTVNPNRPPAASTTRRAAATTSGPTPSPGIVAIRYVLAPVRHGSVSPWRGDTNATETPLISAPWSLLTATR